MSTLTDDWGGNGNVKDVGVDFVVVEASVQNFVKVEPGRTIFQTSADEDMIRFVTKVSGS